MIYCYKIFCLSFYDLYKSSFNFVSLFNVCVHHLHTDSILCQNKLKSTRCVNFNDLGLNTYYHELLDEFHHSYKISIQDSLTILGFGVYEFCDTYTILIGRIVHIRNKLLYDFVLSVYKIIVGMIYNSFEICNKAASSKEKNKRESYLFPSYAIWSK